MRKHAKLKWHSLAINAEMLASCHSAPKEEAAELLPQAEQEHERQFPVPLARVEKSSELVLTVQKSKAGEAVLSAPYVVSTNFL